MENKQDLQDDKYYITCRSLNWSDIELQAKCNPGQYGKALHFIKFSLGYLPSIEICMPHLPFVQTITENVFKDVINIEVFTDEMVFHSKRIRNDDMKKNEWVKKHKYTEEEFDIYHNKVFPEYKQPVRERLSKLIGYGPALEHSLEAEIELRQAFEANHLFAESPYIGIDHRAVTIVRYREAFLLEGEAAADDSELMGLIYVERRRQIREENAPMF